MTSAETTWTELTPDQAPNQRHWHYPANFEGAASGTGRKNRLGLGRKKSETDNVDRWERSVSDYSGENTSQLTTARVSLRLIVVRTDLSSCWRSRRT